MDENQGGEQGVTSGGSGLTRPDVLENISDTQMEELERQYEEGDRSGWLALTNSYGWSPLESEQVWGWFGQRLGGSLLGGS